jgi:hypothetical protein
MALTINEWLLAEAVRIDEQQSGRRDDDQAAITLARSQTADPQHRLMARAAALPGSSAARADILRLRSLLRRLFFALIALGLIGGWVAARASVSAREIDILLSLVTLLALPTLMLVLWLALLVITIRRRSSGSLLGHLLIRILQRLSTWTLKSPLAPTITRAGLSLLQGRLGRWYLSLLSHVFWLAYVTGAMLTLSILFSMAQYDLSWGTTLLTEQAAIDLIGTLAWLPQWLGLLPPLSADWIAAGRAGEMVGPQRALWAQLLLAMVLTYGAAPRLIAGLLCSLLTWRAGLDLKLDLEQPGYVRLLPALMDDRNPSKVHGKPPQETHRPMRARPANAAGPAVLIGMELERSDEDWPPHLPDLDVLVLGRADRRSERQQILEAIQALPKPPPAVIALCSMLRTPDAGVEQFLDRAAEAAGTALVLVADETSLLIERDGNRAVRLADWQALAKRAGGQAVELDLACPEPAGVARLKQLVDGERNRP